MKTGNARSGRAVWRAGEEVDGRRAEDVAEGLKKRLTCILSMLPPSQHRRCVACRSRASAPFDRSKEANKLIHAGSHRFVQNGQIAVEIPCAPDRPLDAAAAQ